jgi:hypothetical protein
MPTDISINSVPAATFYPTFGGPTLGQVGSAASPSDAVAPVNAGTQPEVVRAASVGALGNPLTWWVTIAVLLFALMFVAKRFGSEASEFASIKLSVYNIVVITLAAVIGITFGKAALTRFKIPGLTTVMLAV